MYVCARIENDLVEEPEELTGEAPEQRDFINSIGSVCFDSSISCTNRSAAKEEACPPARCPPIPSATI